MKTTTKRYVSVFCILMGIVGFIKYTESNFFIGIIGSIMFVLGLSVFVDSKIEEAKK